MTDIDEPPRAKPSETTSLEGYGSLKDAVNGNYDFNVGEVISEAWAKTKGAKTPLLMAFFLYGFVVICFNIMLGFLFFTLGFGEMGVSLLVSMMQILLTAPLSVGLFILGVRRSVDASLSSTHIFNYCDQTLSLIATTLLMYLCIALGFLALIIPGIYLSIAYYMALPLVVEKHLSPWQALEVSRKAVGKHWFGVLGLGMLIGLINMLGFLAIGIGLIWTLPMSLIAYGILYRNMFGLEAETLAI